jgi:response regulator RpfG family c-di-GMP phosphodiesterase
LRRFRTELKTVAVLNHPNIVSAFDGGVEFSGDHSYPDIYYFAMEYIDGEDLESYVERSQVLSIQESLDIAYQICMALVEAHKHGLVHRDIKPSNIMLTKGKIAKLLDFGLVRSGGQAMTDPGTMLGTVDYLAPEQAKDASKVDIRADIYSLGATLYFCLTGSAPFPSQSNKTLNLIARMSQDPPSARAIRTELPQELDEVIRKMMATNLENRFQEPASVLQALHPYTISASLKAGSLATGISSLCKSSAVHMGHRPRMKLLLVDDDRGVLEFMRSITSELDVDVETAERPFQALELGAKGPIDLLITDIEMTEMSGLQLIQQMKGLPLQSNMKSIIISGAYSEDQMSPFLRDNVTDIIAKPFSNSILIARIRNALATIARFEEATQTISMLVNINDELEKCYKTALDSSVKTKSCILQSFISIIENKIHESSAHVNRIRLYSNKILAAAISLGDFPELTDPAYVEKIENGSMFHDIGKILLPDTLVGKEGLFSDEERVIMQEHTIIGAKILDDLTKKYLDEMAFLPVAVKIARSHHERFNGKGYPDGLAGEAIPLPARVVSIADVYDALRTDKPYRPAMSHNSAVRIITTCSEGSFDPSLVRAFTKCEKELGEIHNACR